MFTAFEIKTLVFFICVCLGITFVTCCSDFEEIICCSPVVVSVWSLKAMAEEVFLWLMCCCLCIPCCVMVVSESELNSSMPTSASFLDKKDKIPGHFPFYLSAFFKSYFLKEWKISLYLIHFCDSFCLSVLIKVLLVS